MIPPDRWRHVNGKDNSADSASRGLIPLELIKHESWWNGPVWLSLPLTHWPVTDIPPIASLDEETQVCLTAVSPKKSPLLSLEKFSSFTRLKRVTAWTFKFISNCRPSAMDRIDSTQVTFHLSSPKLLMAEHYWIAVIQQECFAQERVDVTKGHGDNRHSSLLPLNPVLDSQGLL